MFIITMIGTERSIPIGPQIVPQNIRDMRITSGERLSFVPISLGSTKFQKNTCAKIIQRRNIRVKESDSNWIRENTTGKNTARIDPTLGI